MTYKQFQNTLFVLFISYSIATFQSIAQPLSEDVEGIQFFQGTFQEALEYAKDQDKLIFVDAYTTWCGPCKRMSRTVFPDKKVGAFYNKHFVSLKLDMEKSEGINFRRKYPVSAYPTLYYLDNDGSSLQKVQGAQTVKKFIDIGYGVLSKIDRSLQYVEAYENGDRSPQLIYNYIKALKQSNKSSLKVANEYLRNQKELNTPENLKIIHIATTEVDSRIFELFVENKKEIEMLIGKEKVAQTIYLASQKTAVKAIQFQSEDLLKQAQKVFRNYLPKQAKIFEYETNLEYFLNTKDSSNYLKTAKLYSQKVIKNDSEGLNDLAQQIVNNFGDHKKAISLAENIAKQAAYQGGTYNYYYNYAMILHKNGKEAEAMDVANTALELAKKIGIGAERMVNGLIQRIEK